MGQTCRLDPQVSRGEGADRITDARPPSIPSLLGGHRWIVPGARGCPRSSSSCWLAAAGAAGPLPALAASVTLALSALVVSEIQTGGASASDEFVEIANQGLTAVDLDRAGAGLRDGLRLDGDPQGDLDRGDAARGGPAAARRQRIGQSRCRWPTRSTRAGSRRPGARWPFGSSVGRSSIPSAGVTRPADSWRERRPTPHRPGRAWSGARRRRRERDRHQRQRRRLVRPGRAVAARIECAAVAGSWRVAECHARVLADPDAAAAPDADAGSDLAAAYAESDLAAAYAEPNADAAPAPTPTPTPTPTPARRRRRRRRQARRPSRRRARRPLRPRSRLPQRGPSRTVPPPRSKAS